MEEPAAISALLEETRRFAPTPAFAAQANVPDTSLYERARADLEGFWAEQARQFEWMRPWTRVLEWNPPQVAWFKGGKLNISVNCVDRHARTWRRNKAAIIWEGEAGEERVLTYGDLLRDVERFAGRLREMGVCKGDTVTMYMGLVPELAIAMLACARLGAVHNVVFGGFAAEAVRDRIIDAGSKVVVCCDAAYRRGAVVPLKRNLDEALEGCPDVHTVVIVRRVGDLAPIQVREGRDHWYHRIMDDAPRGCAPEPMDAEDRLFLLYTSGTTGKPKGIVHTTGGYLVGTASTHRWVFDIKDDDVYWCTADIGWITGHSYVVYGPLANGATQVMYEGAPDWPEKDRFWRIIEKYGVTIFYTAPTAIRAFMAWGTSWLERRDLSSLRLLGSVGEPINPEAWMWYHQNVGRERCPIVDTWWQTETGMILISPLPGITETRPGSATFPLPGIDAQIVDNNGDAIEPGTKAGYLVLNRPWPAMTRGIHGDMERYRQQYWTRFPGRYFTGDGAKQDADGCFWLLGRVDDVMNVAGHRISTMEVESALVDHPDVAEAAVIGRQHELKGQSICAFVTLKQGVSPSNERVDVLKAHVAAKIGAIARPQEIHFTHDLPKTRSGKIMRRLLRDIAEGRVVGDTTTLADAAIVNELKARYESEEG
ncbi:MAG: acetate--CoA ligase [Proteobacteria bacterium]|nr:acetate--CoA ligase [Pseudomonadota bacterium]